MKSTSTAIARHRYDRVAAVYDLLEAPMERMIRPWRKQLWATVPAGDVLEVGVGTGKSIAFYPEHARVTAIDLSERMLDHARMRAERFYSAVKLEVADVQALPYASASFDAVVTTCVFCSVPDPMQGLREVHRVLRPGGRLLMLEHVLSEKPLLRRFMLLFDFVPYRLWGAHINRDTVGNVRAAHFAIEQEENVTSDVVKRVRARKLA